MDVIGSLLTALGLSASAGLNAYIPLLIVAVIGRFTNWITLATPWDALESWWAIGALVVLTSIEFFADKVPAVNHINDALQTFVRPVAGGILFAASTNVVTNIHPIVAVIAGLIVAGSVHTVKSAAVRPALTATTGGAANVAASIAEDVAATVLSIVAVVLPVLVAAVIIVTVSLFIWWLWRRSNAVGTA